MGQLRSSEKDLYLPYQSSPPLPERKGEKAQRHWANIKRDLKMENKKGRDLGVEQVSDESLLLIRSVGPVMRGQAQNHREMTQGTVHFSKNWC